MSSHISKLKRKIIDQLIDADHALIRALGQYKWPMVSYYYGVISKLLTIVGRTSDILDLLPGYNKLTSFTNEFKSNGEYSSHKKSKINGKSICVNCEEKKNSTLEEWF